MVGFALQATPIAAQDESRAATKPLFGELHMHTRYSFDAYVFLVRATPDDAYNFAKGEPLMHPLGETYQMSRPLDFMAVTDHAVLMGVFNRMGDENHPLSKHPLAAQVTSDDPSVAIGAFVRIVTASRSGEPIEGLNHPDVFQDAWDRTIEAANRHYEPGTFTTFIGYEWTSTPDGQNLHRNVIFKGDTAPLPFTAADSPVPEDLWTWMDEIRAEGHEVLAIPHNSNLSDGRMFELEDSSDNAFTSAYADSRNRNEPLVEVTQVKGTSETHPALSPNDEFADFEILEQYVALPIPVKNFKGSYVRDALRSGLEFQDKEGFNPYRFGLVGASDSHTGIIPVEENTYSGKVGARDGSPEQRLLSSREGSLGPRNFSASGLTGVWAAENTRDGVYAAFRRKETWATSGPRIKIRFFGGFGLDEVDPNNEGWVEAAYAGGVSMGGELKAVDAGGAPTFIVWAMKDAETANLDRIQIVKGWSESGVSHEKVYDVAWSDGRVPDPETGKVPAVGNTVDLETLEYANTIGSVELKGKWTDPDFDPEQNAFYYARAIEIPTPRWNLFDAKALGIPNPSDMKATLQERAYTSPIRYDHP